MSEQNIFKLCKKMYIIIMEVKKYKPEFVLDYLYKNRKKYNKYFQKK